jgi:spore cortex formation protein SpoVR/YcgB (stage V sporulation)
MSEEYTTMSNSEEETVAALRLLFEKVAELSAMNIREMLTPGKYDEFKATLDTAYDSLVQIEDALDSLGMKVEYHHWRISSAFEELKPLAIQPRTRYDTALETFEQDLQRKHGRSYQS